MNRRDPHRVDSVKRKAKKRERMRMMARNDDLPEATLRDTFDHIPLVVAVLVLANVAAAAAIGRSTYNLVRGTREAKVVGPRRLPSPTLVH
jgi:hypothetical protein